MLRMYRTGRAQCAAQRVSGESSLDCQGTALPEDSASPDSPPVAASALFHGGLRRPGRGFRFRLGIATTPYVPERTECPCMLSLVNGWHAPGWNGECALEKEGVRKCSSCDAARCMVST